MPNEEIPREEVPAEEIPDDDDGAVLRSLRDHGVDLSAPLSIEFAIAAPSAPAAEQIAAAIAANGHAAEVSFDPGEPPPKGSGSDAGRAPSWAVFVAVEMLPRHAEIAALHQRLLRIAEPSGGRSDGWGVTI